MHHQVLTDTSNLVLEGFFVIFIEPEMNFQTTSPSFFVVESLHVLCLHLGSRNWSSGGLLYGGVYQWFFCEALVNSPPPRIHRGIWGNILLLLLVYA